MATFEMKMDEMVRRLRFPEGTKIRSVEIVRDKAVFHIAARGGELRLIDVPYSRKQTVVWQGSEPKFVPADEEAA